MTRKKEWDRSSPSIDLHSSPRTFAAKEAHLFNQSPIGSPPRPVASAEAHPVPALKAFFLYINQETLIGWP